MVGDDIYIKFYSRKLSSSTRLAILISQALGRTLLIGRYTSLLLLIRRLLGLKGSGPFFQRSMANKVLAGYVTRIQYARYIDDVLIHGPTDNEYLGNTRKILGRLRE